MKAKITFILLFIIITINTFRSQDIRYEVEIDYIKENAVNYSLNVYGGRDIWQLYNELIVVIENKNGVVVKKVHVKTVLRENFHLETTLANGIYKIKFCTITMILLDETDYFSIPDINKEYDWY